VRIKDLDSPPDPTKTYWAETDPDQACEAKPPYRDVHLSGHVEAKFLFSAVIAKHILPFAVLEPATVILPIETDAHGLRILTADLLTRDGYRDAGNWFRRAEHLWNEKRGAKAQRQSIYEWLDYQGKLTAQDLGHRHLVLYNAAGTNLSAAYYDRNSHSAHLIVDHKLYCAGVPTPSEAHYLVALLNSGPFNEAIKPFQSRGLLGERDIHKKVLDLPIPGFDNENPHDLRLAELGRNAHESAQLLVPKLAASRRLGRQRSEMRTALAIILSEIDGIVREMLTCPPR